MPPVVHGAAQVTSDVRVIVRLAVDRPDAQAIAGAQDEVLAALRGTRYRVLQRYANSPYLALEVGADARKALDHAPRVLSVSSDFELRPMAPATPR